MLSIAFLYVSCQMEENVLPDNDIRMKVVTLSANMDASDSTKASLDNLGIFTWQEGDKISVLSTDNKFYVFGISEGAGTRNATFTGEIPETAEVSNIATYPAIVSNGADNTIVSGDKMTFTLPDVYEYIDENTNVSMVAKGDLKNEGMSFKQIGGVMRFPVNNLPRKAKFVFTSANKRVNGDYPLDLSKIGESFIESNDNEGGSTLIINYSSDFDGKPASFNVPLPVGIYNDFIVSIQDECGNTLFSKEYHSDKNKIERKTLRLMKELQLDAIPVSVEFIYPYFVNARVLWRPQYGSDGYALYVDNNEPIILRDLQVNSNGLLEYSFGDFEHGTEHNVMIAKVVGNDVDEKTKSDRKTFKTGEIWQICNNVGSTHICFEYTNIAGTTGAKGSAYNVQVFDTEDTLKKPEYSFYTVDLNVKKAGVYAGRQWYSMTNGKASIIPMRISVGNLMPGKDYYIRIKSVGSLEHKVSVGVDEGNTKAEAIVLYSMTGESKYSKLYRITTEQTHSSEVNEVLFEGFDDLFLGTDYINSSATLIPVMQAKEGKYISSLKTNYKAFREIEDKKWCVCTAQFNECGTFEEYGFAVDGAIIADYSIKDWEYTGRAFPGYGFVFLGRNDIASLRTNALESDNLSDSPVPCIVTLNACPLQYGPEAIYDNIRIDVYKPDGLGNYVVASIGDTKRLANNREWSDKKNYKNHYGWQEVRDTVMLAKGWKLQVTIPNPSSCSNASVTGCVAIDDIHVVANASLNPVVDSRPESVADHTNYYSYGEDFFPISYWWDVPAAFASKARYEEVKEAGFNVVLHTGEVDRSFEANKQIASWCKDLGIKYIGYGLGDTAAERIQNTKELKSLYPDTYVGDFGWDEPSANLSSSINSFVSEYQAEMSDCQMYVNLFPSYARSYQLGVSGYSTYLDNFLSCDSYKSISFDTYPLKKNGAIRRDYFYNLDIVRAKTLEKKLPFWVITQSAASVNKNVTEPMIRWTVWVDLAFGSKGIAYFTYWQPVGYDDYKYMIARDGTRNPTYNWIKQINSDVMMIGKTLMNCHADGVITTSFDYTLYERRFSYGPVSSVSATSGAIVGCFTDVTTGAKKVLVVNELPTINSNTVELNVDNTVALVKITRNNDSTTMLPSEGKLTLSLSQGEAVLVEF